MYIDIIKLLVGLVILILGGDFLVRGASGIALKIQISPLVVGLTVVAFGTSAPELLISLEAVLTGSPDIAVANVVGSNICNLALVLGITAVIYPVSIQKNSLKIDWPLAIGSALLLYFFSLKGALGIFEGSLFVTTLVIYTYFIIKNSRRDTRKKKAMQDEMQLFELEKERGRPLWIELLFLGLGGAGLYFGAGWFVDGAQSVAALLGVSERIIGLTVIAIGTSLPELVTSCIASIKKESDIAIGNLLGSNIFNVLSILGIVSIVKEIKVSEEIISIDMPWMLGITFMIFPMMLIQRRISRWEGAILLLTYVVYLLQAVS